MLIEVKFKGIFHVLDFNFLKQLLIEAREVYFNSPEIESILKYDDVVSIINSNTYVDLVINTDNLHINKKNIPSVFVNLGRSNDQIELLFFFDLKDLNEPTQKMSMEYLKLWVERIKNDYSFQYFICQIDNAEKDEYFFDSFGVGKLYDGLAN